MIYRQIARRLRVDRGPGHPDLVSERPTITRADGSYEFTDSDANPTLVEFDETCRVNLPELLRLGAIVAHTPAKAPAKGTPAGGE